MADKVVHIITGLGDGGAEGVLTRLCLGSKRADHVVVSMMDDGKYGELLRNEGVKLYTLDMKQGKFSLSSFWRLIRILKAEKPEVVQTWMYHADLIGGMAGKLTGVKRIFWGIRHSTLDAKHSKKSTILVARICALLSRWVPSGIVCCAEQAAAVHQTIGYCRSKLTVVPNGIDLSRFRSNEASRSSIREEFGIDQKTFLIGMVARANPQKNHEGLLQALSRFKEHFDNFQCLLVGRDVANDNAPLVKLTKELGLTENVILAGQRKDVEGLMNALDLHVLSSRFGEGFPNVVAEAMACQTVSIATDVGDSRLIVGDGRLCCEADNPSELSSLFLEMARTWSTEPEVWEGMRIKARERVESRFSVETMIENYESVWFANSD